MHQPIIHADCLDHMRTMADNSIDCIVTDSPYGISFMGKGWDKGIPSIEYWQEMLRILKPGGHLLAAGLPRMMHRIICIIEDAGFQIRDLLMHLFGSGFPKSHNHFGREGYGTALKPAWEGWSLAMKPLDGTFAQNAEKWGVAGINIDASRIGTTRRLPASPSKNNNGMGFIRPPGIENKDWDENKGRWPANLLLGEEAAEMLDQMTGGNVSRFFYCPKSSSAERNAGLEGMPDNVGKRTQSGGDDTRGRPLPQNKNPHPTVKPLALMRYLLKLVMPPNPNAIVLDPFAGSGSTLVAAKQLGFNAIGIEKEAEYCEIARKRVESAKQDDPKLNLGI